MPLEDLLELVETLRKRIEEHGPALRKSEAQTRYALIDPLLRALGWDTTDPAQLVPEYAVSGGHADYSLLVRGTPRIIIEAKKLGESMQGAARQGINYCQEKGTLYFAVTDGQRWELYETHKPVPLEEKLVTGFDLKVSPAEVRLKALAPWRPSVEGGRVQVGEPPVVGAGSPTVEPEPPTPPVPHLPVAEAGWIALAGHRPGQGAPKPIEVLCPTGKRIQVKSWYGLRQSVVQWLVEDGHLASADAKNPDYHQNANTEVERTESNIKHAGMDPAEFKVRLAD